MTSYTHHPYPEDPPDVLRCVKGKIVMADGSDATAYLKQWAKFCKLTPDTPINLTRRDQHMKMRDQSAMMQFWGA